MVSDVQVWGAIVFAVSVTILTVTGIYGHPWAFDFKNNWKTVTAVVTASSRRTRKYTVSYSDPNTTKTAEYNDSKGVFSSLPDHLDKVTAYYNAVDNQLTLTAPYKTEEDAARALIVIVYIVVGIATIVGMAMMAGEKM